jgi:DinB family protein
MKAKLLDLIDAGREKEEQALVPFVDDSAPESPGKWTAKDQLAHLMSWRQVAIGELDSARTGGPVPDVSTDDEAENLKFYAQTHDQPARLIIESAAGSWDAMAEAVSACSEETLEGPRPRYPNQKLWTVVPLNVYNHVAQHLAYWSWDRDDETAAEQAAIWGHDLAIATFPDDRTRGAAEYNLACIYAQRGMAERAVPLLKRGFELRPDLKEWAKTDTDLDPIRSNPELVELLS